MALAAALPNHPQKERATLFTVIGVSALSTLAMIVYPMIAHGLSLMLACINSTGWIAPAVQGGVNEFSRWCLVISISAPGMQGFTGLAPRYSEAHHRCDKHRFSRRLYQQSPFFLCALKGGNSAPCQGATACFCARRHAAGGMPNWLMNQRVKELAMEKPNMSAMLLIEWFGFSR